MAEDHDSSPPPDSGKSSPPEARKPKRKLLTRRRVLIGAGGLLGAGAVGAGAYAIYDRQQRFGRSALRTIADHRVELPSSTPKMVIAHGTDPAATVRGALGRLGGLEQFISKDDVVVVKPNIGWDRAPNQAANTHPDVVAEVVRSCRAVGAKRVVVTDCPTSEARRAFERSGILRAAGDAGAEVILPEESRYHTVKLSDRLGTWEVLEPFIEATKIINVPVGKHHSLSGVTGGMKNWIGITTFRRMSFHGAIDQSIAELSALMLPTLTIIDASRVLMEHGPRGGNLADVKDVGAIAATIDPVAADAWICSLLRDPNLELPGYLHMGERMGLGRVDFRALDPAEVQIG